MRALTIAVLAAAGFATAVSTAAVAAELEVQPAGCGRGYAWDGYQCAPVAPRAYHVPPAYVAPPVVVAAPLVVAPPVYVEPFYARPVVRYYAGPRYVVSGPRYVYGARYAWAGPHYRWAARGHGPRRYSWRR